MDAVAERSHASFSDIVSDASRRDRFLFVDGKGEQVLSVELTRDLEIRVLGATALGRGRARTMPTWAIRLPRAQPPTTAGAASRVTAAPTPNSE